MEFIFTECLDEPFDASYGEPVKRPTCDMAASD